MVNLQSVMKVVRSRDGKAKHGVNQSETITQLSYVEKSRCGGVLVSGESDKKGSERKGVGWSGFIGMIHDIWAIQMIDGTCSQPV